MRFQSFLFVAALALTAPAFASGPDVSVARGEEVFTQHCATCHGEAGAGDEPWYPALTRLAALRDPADMVRTLITGRFRRGGEIEGHTIPIMPEWGQLSNADVAAVVNYIQKNWGDGRELTLDEAADIREELWTLD